MIKHARTCGDVSDHTWRMFLLERQIRRMVRRALPGIEARRAILTVTGIVSL